MSNDEKLLTVKDAMYRTAKTRTEYTCTDTTIGDCYVDPGRLTHEMPFLAADGVPLKVFEAVFDMKTGIAYSVAELPVPGACNKVRLYRCGAEDGFSWYFDASQLTHSQPCAKEGE